MAVFSLLPYLDSREATGYLLLLTGVYRGQEFGFTSASVLVLRPPGQRSSWWVRDGVKVRVGRRGECLLRLLSLFCVFQREILIYQYKRNIVFCKNGLL